MNDETIAVVKAAPAVAGATLYSLTLQEWVAIVTIAYVLLQAGLLVPKYWRLFCDRRNGKRD